jgi:hypothetical protein
VDYCAAPPCAACQGDEGSTFIFYSGNSTGVGGLDYKWEFEGTGSTGYTGSQTTATWTYVRPHNPGSYPNGWPAILTVTDQNGTPASSTAFVKINNVAPTAIAYTVDPGGQRQDTEAFLYINQTYQFFGQESSDKSYFSGNGISAYSWDFSYDGVSFNPEASNQNPFKQFTQLGTYTVRLRVRDDDSPYAESFDNITVTVINQGPFARIEGPDVSFTEGEQVRFDGNSSGSAVTITNWEWDFDYIHPTFTVDATGQTVYKAFGDARVYSVALRVSDAQGNTFLTFEPYTPENIMPTAVLKVKDRNGVLQEQPYTVPEGVALSFDARDSYPTPPDPGHIVGYQWDWNYNGFTFLPDPTATSGIISHSYLEDTDHTTTPGTPYKVRLRVIDDDSDPPEHPSDDYLTVDVWVTDVPPLAQIQVCNAAGANCAPPAQGQTVELPEGDLGVFHVEDVGGNTDNIVEIDWDFYYDGSFSANPAFADQDTVEFAWDAISSQRMAVRIIDDDGAEHIAAMDVFIIDKAPTAIITPNGTDRILTVDEGSQVNFSAQSSSIAPDDVFARFRWDESYTTADLFTPDDQHDLESTCTGGVCSRFSWLSCGTDEDCPGGRGVLPMTMGDGPSSFKIALCVEDVDNQGVCVAGADPNSDSVKPRIYVLQVNVRNVAPTFDSGYLPPSVINEGQTYSWCPVIIEPAGLVADPLSFDCLPANLPTNMECNPSNGCQSWSPAASDVSCTVGQKLHPYSLKVCDNDNGCNTISGTIEVRNVNDPPTITGFDGTNTALSGQEYLATLYAEDPDDRCGENMLYYLCGDKLPQMTIDLNGIFRWTPTNAQVGSRTVGMCVRDDQGAEDCSVCYYQQITVAPAEEVPVINLGQDQNLEPGQVCMVGTITSNPGDHDLDYTWRQNTGPQDVCLGEFTEYPTPPKACFVASSHGNYEFSATADNGTYSGQDRVIITLSNVTPGAVVPGDRNYEMGSIVELDGSRSGDYNANDNSLLFQWTDWREVLNDTTTSNPTFVALESLGVGLFEFELQTDDGFLTSPPGAGFTTIEILELDQNGDVVDALPYATFRPLVCDSLGVCEDADTTLPVANEEFILDAGASTSRPAGKELVYSWDYLGDGPSTPQWRSPASDLSKLNVTAYLAGRYTFALRVTDGDKQSRLYTRTVTVSSPPKRAPVADAGDDQKVSLLEQCTSPRLEYLKIELDGSGSHDPDMQSISYRWTQVGGIPVPLNFDTTAEPNFYVFSPGLYSFELVVEDGELESIPDVVNIAVSAAGGSSPFISISHPRYNREKRTITVDPGQEVVIDASSSSSATGNEIEFDWSQLSGPPVALSSWTDDIVSFKPDISGQTYVFRLTVWDDEGSPSLPFDLNVVVLLEANSPPTCSVADDQIDTIVGNLVDLDASTTRDIDATDVLTYRWTQILDESVAELTITDANQMVATVQPTTVGTYVFEFTANDGYEDCEPVRVTVSAAQNSAPVAEAGTDQEACVGDSIQLDGSSSFDPDGQPLEYQWSVLDDGGTGIATADFTPDSGDPTPTIRAIDSGLLVIELRVTDGFENGDSEPDTIAVLIQARCDGVDCVDNDKDGYFVGEDCDFDDEETPLDCDDDDKNRNAGIPGSCETDTCIDNDFDECCSNIEPLDPDDNDPTVTCRDDQPDGDGGGGGGCRNSDANPVIWALMLALGVLGLWRARRRKV